MSTSKKQKTTTTTSTTGSNSNSTGKTKKSSSSIAPKIGANIIELQASLLKRPARKQSTHLNSRFEEHDVDTTEYNIWYHKKLGNKNWKDRDVSETRCNVLKDCGKTRAGKDAYFCSHFARGRCINGADCTYLHRVPTPDDDKRLELTHDIFGRERHKTDREDMNGVGSFSRDNRTLYVGGIKSNVSGSLEDMVRKNFEEWGTIEYVRVIVNRSISFVRYMYRSSAEFAKEAMTDQTLDNGELLNIRWATEDSNPYAKKVDERNLHRVATEVINKRIREMTPDDQSALKFQMTGQYPNTDVQYDPNTGQPINAGNSSAYQLQYRGSTKYEVHPYAQSYNKDLQKRIDSGTTGDDVAPLNGVGNYYSHTVGSMNQELQKQQYEQYMQQYYQSLGYDYSKLPEDQKLQLQQYYQNYYYGQQQSQQQIENNEEDEDDDEEDEEDEDEEEKDKKDNNTTSTTTTDTPSTTTTTTTADTSKEEEKKEEKKEEEEKE